MRKPSFFRKISNAEKMTIVQRDTVETETEYDYFSASTT